MNKQGLENPVKLQFDTKDFKSIDAGKVC